MAFALRSSRIVASAGFFSMASVAEVADVFSVATDDGASLCWLATVMAFHRIIEHKHVFT